jgi:hypothetical protein
MGCQKGINVDEKLDIQPLNSEDVAPDDRNTVI